MKWRVFACSTNIHEEADVKLTFQILYFLLSEAHDESFQGISWIFNDPWPQLHINFKNRSRKTSMVVFCADRVQFGSLSDHKLLHGDERISHFHLHFDSFNIIPCTELQKAKRIRHICSRQNRYICRSFLNCLSSVFGLSYKYTFGWGFEKMAWSSVILRGFSFEVWPDHWSSS